MKTKSAVPSRERLAEGLAEVLGAAGDDYPYHYLNARIALSSVIVLPQPRQTFENIRELAEDIAQKGVLNPPTIARFRPSAFERYLKVVNHLWKTDFDAGQFKPASEGGVRSYYVLLAGERRFRACSLLWGEGCAACRGDGTIPEGRCFRRHFRGSKIDVRLCADIPPLPALFLQLSENTHIRVPEHEEAYAYAQLFGLIREVDPRYPLSHFARRVGRSPGTIQRALRFCELPRQIQQLVEERTIRYGIAVEITRLQTNGFTTDDLLWWAQTAMAKGYRVPEFRLIITEKLVHLTSGQMDLLDIMGELEKEMRRRSFIRKTVSEGTINALWQWTHYLQTVLALCERGQLGVPDSPFSSRSPRRVLQTILDLFERLDPHLNKLLPRRDVPRMRAAVLKLRPLLVELDEADPETHKGS